MRKNLHRHKFINFAEFSPNLPLTEMAGAYDMTIINF